MISDLKAVRILIFTALLLQSGRVSISTPLLLTDPVKTDVFVSGEGGYHTYRIPALVVNIKGTVLAFAEGRVSSSRDFGDMDLVLKRSRDGGKTWGSLQVIADLDNHARNGPVPVVDRESGRLLLLFTLDKDRVFVMGSDDEGVAWSAPREITPDVKLPGWTWYATGPGHGIQLRSGRLLVPCDHMEPEAGRPSETIHFKTMTELATRRRGVMHSHVIYSDDHGATWKLGGILDKHTDEATAVELSDGTIYLNLRHTIRNPYAKFWNWHRAYALSGDGGLTWSETRFSQDLTTPVCQGAVLRLSEAAGQGRNRLLYSGPAAKRRQKMTVWTSYDEGMSWPVKRAIYPGPAAYSDLAVLPDLTIAILYENGTKNPYRKITFERFSLEWLTEGKDSLEKE